MHVAGRSACNLVQRQSYRARRSSTFRLQQYSEMRTQIAQPPSCVAGAAAEGAAPKELFRVPAHAEWFRYDRVHMLERNALPDFFRSGASVSASKNPLVRPLPTLMMSTLSAAGLLRPAASVNVSQHV